MTLDHDSCYRIFVARDRRFDGRLFVGVHTTGIYCRPVCPAPPPKQRNVTFYTTASAANDAGFRPCLRCRPEVSPNLVAWHGTAAVVSRALRLIEDGALDHGSVDQLAARVGMGERQLRRLFLRHLGASPVAVARTRRLHLAAQLIRDTELPMIEVASASGFTSVRRFNEVMLDTYGRPPSSIRRKSIAAQTGVLMLQLPCAAPYAWTDMLDDLRRTAIDGVEVVSDVAYRRSFQIAGGRGTVCVSRVQDDLLTAAVTLSQIDLLPKILARLRTVFDLATDPIALAKQLAANQQLLSALEARPGLRIPGPWDLFETAVRTILGCRQTHPSARTLTGRFVRAFGGWIQESCGGLSRYFPAPGDVAGRNLGDVVPERQARAISALARAEICNASPLQFHLDEVEMVRKISALPDIDPEMGRLIAMKLATPSDDVSELDPETAYMLEVNRPWRAYAAAYLRSGAKSIELGVPDEA